MQLMQFLMVVFSAVMSVFYRLLLLLLFIVAIYRYFDSLLLYAAVSYTTQLVPLIGCGCFARE
ncbi:hypothetical protein [Psychrobacter sp. A3]|uniref:hypothetical protein n=1 Tax=Psychrobacter sp. A3 TaxID=2992754 RepID=UPI00237A944F|nr:hypothetical protein [Psychrobacter sp. A3]